MVTKVFIDGEHGTTGLQIQKRLEKRTDLKLLSLAHKDRHNVHLRKDYLTQADIAILCLPDDAARKTVHWLRKNKNIIRVIDSSTAHRVAPNWVYGFPEMTAGQKKRIQAAHYVSNPGCYPTGAISLIRPLREAGLLDADYPISIHAISGYTGGGKQLITQMENQSQENIQENYFIYGLNLEHKHVPEIKIHGQINQTPLFIPSVGHFPQGMIVNLPLHRHLFTKSANSSDLREILANHYEGQNIISVASQDEIASLQRLNPECFANKDGMKLFVFGNDREGVFNLCALFDNLGKGASAAAIQNLDLMLSAN